MAVLHLASAPPREAVPPSDGAAAEALRAAAQLLGPTTRATLLRRGCPGLGEADRERVWRLLGTLKSLGDLVGDPRGAAVAPAPLRALRLSAEGEAVARYLLVGGPRTSMLRLPAHVAAPFLRVARLMAPDEGAFCARVQALGGLVLPWSAWAGGRRARLDEEFLAERAAALESEASEQGLPDVEGLRLCRPGTGPEEKPTRWTPPRKADSGWFLARRDRRLFWARVEGGRPERAVGLPFGEAAALQFALERRAGAPRKMQVQLLGQEDPARLVLPSPLPREEWRLVRALASGVAGREWTLAAPDALWLAQLLPERLGVRVEHL